MTFELRNAAECWGVLPALLEMNSIQEKFFRMCSTMPGWPPVQLAHKSFFFKKRLGKHKLRNKIEILVLLLAGGEALTVKYCVAAYDTAVVVVLLLSLLLLLLLCLLPQSFKFLYIFEYEYFLQFSEFNKTLFFTGEKLVSSYFPYPILHRARRCCRNRPWDRLIRKKRKNISAIIFWSWKTNIIRTKKQQQRQKSPTTAKPTNKNASSKTKNNQDFCLNWQKSRQLPSLVCIYVMPCSWQVSQTHKGHLWMRRGWVESCRSSRHNYPRCSNINIINNNNNTGKQQEKEQYLLFQNMQQ